MSTTLTGLAGQSIGQELVASIWRPEDGVWASETRLRGIMDSLPVIVSMTDPAGRCTYVNRQWYAYTGRTQGEDQGLPACIRTISVPSCRRSRRQWPAGSRST